MIYNTQHQQMWLWKTTSMLSTGYTNCTIIVSSFPICYKMCINVQTKLLLWSCSDTVQNDIFSCFQVLVVHCSWNQQHSHVTMIRCTAGNTMQTHFKKGTHLKIIPHLTLVLQGLMLTTITAWLLHSNWIMQHTNLYLWQKAWNANK